MGHSNRRRGDFAVALFRVTVSRREQSAGDFNRQKERNALDEFFAVHIAARDTGWGRGLQSGDVLRHPHHTEKRTERDLVTELVAPDARFGIERPAVHEVGQCGDAEAIIRGATPASCDCPTPIAGNKPLDFDFERHTGFRPLDKHGPTQGVSCIENGITRFELLARLIVFALCFDAPGGVEGGKAYGIARLNGENRGQITRKMSMQSFTFGGKGMKGSRGGS